MASRTERTSVGDVTISETDGRITSLTFGGSSSDSSGALDEAFGQLNEYLLGKRRAFELELAPEGTPFQKEVWNALLKIPYGRTASYSDVARMIGRPGSQRAVGNAVGSNPIAIMIPCHRVIRSDGSLGGFAFGPEIKRKLLAAEGLIWK